jgi:hypothetical protein
MSELNNAIDIQIIERHLGLKIHETNLQDLLNEIAVKLNWYEQKVLDLEHALDLKEKALSRQLGLT